MSLQTAAAGFNLICKQKGLFFNIPYVCNHIFIGQDSIDLLKCIGRGLAREGGISQEGKDIVLQDSLGEYFRYSKAGAYACGFVFKNLVAQIPEELKYVHKSNTYITDTIVDGHMLWLKSDNEVRIKQVKDAPGTNVSTEGMGIVLTKVSKSYVNEEILAYRSILDIKKSKYSAELFDNSEELNSLRSAESELLKKKCGLEHNLRELSESLGAHDTTLSGIVSEYDSIKALYRESKSELMHSVENYGSYSAQDLIQDGYLREENNGSLTYISDSRRPDTIKHEKQIVRKKVPGKDPVTGHWFSDDDTFKYHYKTCEYTKKVVIVDAEWEQAKYWSEREIDLNQRVSRLYDRLQSIDFQKSVAENSKATFEKGIGRQLGSQKRTVQEQLYQVSEQLAEVRMKLYGKG